MKNKRYKLICLMTFLICFICKADAQEAGFVVFVDSIQQTMQIRQRMLWNLHSLPYRWNTSVSDTLYSRKGKIMAIRDPNSIEFTNGVDHCLRMAMDIWEDKLDISVPIPIIVSYSYDMDDEVEIKTSVNYSRVSRSRSRVNSLYTQNYSLPINPDTILINANIDWNSAWAYDISATGSDNLITGLLRHIGHVLGFGCSVKELNGVINFSITRTPSDFDYLMYDDQETPLSSFTSSSSALTMSGFMSRALHLNISGNYSLFSSSDGYVPYRSGMYFSLQTNNLMNYPYESRSLLRNVNSETLDALEAIGWTTTPHDVSIESSTLDEAGYGSYYTSHTYQAIDNTGSVINNASWKFQTYSNMARQYCDVLENTGSSFTVGGLSVISDFIDEYQCLQGRVLCEITKNGITTTYSKPVFLELRPELVSISVENVVASTSTSTFSFDLRLNCRGTNSGQVSICNEYGQVLTYSFTGSGEKLIHVNNAFSLGQTSLDLLLENNYGDNVKLILYEDIPGADVDQIMLLPISELAIQDNVSSFDKGNRDTQYIRDGDKVAYRLTQADGSSYKLHAGQNVVWKIIVQQSDGSYWERTLESDSVQCSFIMSPSLIGNNAHRFITNIDQLTQAVYSEGVIRAYVKSGSHVYGYKDYPIRLEVLPPMPTITILSHQEKSDSCCGASLPYTELEIYACNFRTGAVEAVLKDWPTTTGVYFSDKDLMPLHVTVDWAYPGSGYRCWLNNDYGFTISDIIYPSVDKIADIEVGKVRITQKGEMCVVSFPHIIDCAVIADIYGREYFAWRKEKRVQLHIPKGIYVLKWNENGKSNSRKFNIK